MRLDAYKWEQAKPAAGLPLTRPSEIGLKVRRLGLQDYVPLWQAMRYLAEHPRQGRDDEIWMLSHKPVFTQGQAGRQNISSMRAISPLCISIAVDK